MTNTPEQTLSDLLALGEAVTPGPWVADKSDTDAKRHAVFADAGRLAGVGQVAIMPWEFVKAKENAAFIAASKNALPAIRSTLERLKEIDEAVREMLPHYEGMETGEGEPCPQMARLRSLMERK